MRGFTTRARSGRTVVRAQARHRRGPAARPAHLSLGRDDHHHRRSWRLPRSFRIAPAVRRARSRMESVSTAAMVADSPDEVRVRVREQLLLGASQIKLTAGGGVASPHSPLDVSTFTEDELRAAVQAAENWGTYVTRARVHAGRHPARDRGGRQGHRAWPLDGRDERQTDGREGHLAEFSAVHG